MPLVSGYSQQAISENIRRLVDEGYDQRQAVAISYSEAREAAKKIQDKHKRDAVMRRLKKRRKS